MGTPREPKPAKFFVGILLSDAKLFSPVENDLDVILGAVDARSEVVSWSATKFYAKEMGSALLRGFLSFNSLRSPSGLAGIKLRTQELEERYRDSISNGRRVNLDPGYLDSLKVVLASTKNASQRIYFGSGIYGEVALRYYDGAFHGLPYSYPDYLSSETRAFLMRVRSAYLKQLSQSS